MPARRPTVTERVREALDGIVPSRGQANSALLFNVRKWQEAKVYAEAELKKAWKIVQKPIGSTETDDEMRARGTGEHIVSEAGQFSVTAKVASASRTLSIDALVIYMNREHDIPPGDMLRIIEECKVEGTASLSKRVLEA